MTTPLDDIDPTMTGGTAHGSAVLSGRTRVVRGHALCASLMGALLVACEGSSPQDTKAVLDIATASDAGPGTDAASDVPDAASGPPGPWHFPELSGPRCAAGVTARDGSPTCPGECAAGVCFIGCTTTWLPEPVSAPHRVASFTCMADSEPRVRARALQGNRVYEAPDDGDTLLRVRDLDTAAVTSLVPATAGPLAGVTHIAVESGNAFVAASDGADTVAFFAPDGALLGVQAVPRVHDLVALDSGRVLASVAPAGGQGPWAVALVPLAAAEPVTRLGEYTGSYAYDSPMVLADGVLFLSTRFPRGLALPVERVLAAGGGPLDLLGTPAPGAAGVVSGASPDGLHLRVERAYDYGDLVVKLVAWRLQVRPVTLAETRLAILGSGSSQSGYYDEPLRFTYVLGQARSPVAAAPTDAGSYARRPPGAEPERGSRPLPQDGRSDEASRAAEATATALVLVSERGYARVQPSWTLALDPDDAPCPGAAVRLLGVCATACDAPLEPPSTLGDAVALMGVVCRESDTHVVAGVEGEAVWFEQTTTPQGLTLTYLHRARLGYGNSAAPVLGVAVAETLATLGEATAFAVSDAGTTAVWAGGGLQVTAAGVTALAWLDDRRLLVGAEVCNGVAGPGLFLGAPGYAAQLAVTGLGSVERVIVGRSVVLVTSRPSDADGALTTAFDRAALEAASTNGTPLTRVGGTPVDSAPVVAIDLDGRAVTVRHDGATTIVERSTLVLQGGRYVTTSPQLVAKDPRIHGAAASRVVREIAVELVGGLAWFAY